MDFIEHMRMMRDKRNELPWWFERMKDIGMPMPATLSTEIDFEMTSEGNVFIKDESKKAVIEMAEEMAEEFGWPLFMKTYNQAFKHSFKNTCLIQNKDVIVDHMYEMVIQAMMDDTGPEVGGIVIREYNPLMIGFKAFHGEMPIAIELRVFIKDGKYQCHHFYWPTGAISRPDHENWKNILYGMKVDAELYGIKKVKPLAEKIAKHPDFQDYWSIDFAKTEGGRWILIDMALGEVSFHDTDCEHCSGDMKAAYGDRDDSDTKTKMELDSELEEMLKEISHDEKGDSGSKGHSQSGDSQTE